MNIRRDKVDIIFSKCVRERDNHTCQMCGTTYGKMECSHHWSRRHTATRFDPDNAACFCHTCHRKWHSDPPGAKDWLRKYLGDPLYDIVEEKANSIRKMPKWEKEEIYQHYRKELKRLEQERIDGATGRLELENPL